jgi:hypothetical protein
VLINNELPLGYNPFDYSFDWINLTQRHPNITLNDKIEKIWRTTQALKGMFKFPNHIDTNGEAPKTTSLCGQIYITCTKQYLQVQLRGTFFLYNYTDYFQLMELIYIQLSRKVHHYPLIQDEINKALEKPKSKQDKILNKIFTEPTTQSAWTITRADIRKDYFGIKVVDVLPTQKDNDNYFTNTENYHWTTETETVAFRNKKGDITGFTHNMTRTAKLLIYNKTEENKIQKNKEKEQMFNQLYKVENGDIITRVEVRLDQRQRNTDLTKYLQGRLTNTVKAKSPKELMRQMLKRFAYKNRVLIPNPTDKNQARWEIEPRYKQFIEVGEDFVRERPTRIEILQKSEENNTKRALATLINQKIKTKLTNNEKMELTDKDKERMISQIEALFKSKMTEIEEMKEAVEHTKQFKRALAERGIDL